MKLIFERSRSGKACSILPPCDVAAAPLDAGISRKLDLHLPQLSEPDISRHYSALSRHAHGVNNGFYPLGSCTMKYNPRINEEMAALPGFSQIHPLQPTASAQGCLEALYTAEKFLCQVTGMDAMSFQPGAGAHGEFTGLLLINAYHKSRGDLKRTKIIVPDSAHGTNPASASMAGFSVVNLPSNEQGHVDLTKLAEVCGDDTVGLMLTNPSTLGFFEKDILEITKIVHEAGGLVYYDGANLNAIVGLARPGDMGFDVIHLNLHKTFSTPHGCGGPGSGPVGCKDFLAGFLPNPRIVEKDGLYDFADGEASIGRVKAFYGNFLVVIKALTYIYTVGGEGLKEVAKVSVLNANYLKTLVQDFLPPSHPGFCMHEFVASAEELKKEYGVTAMDIAKSLLDYDIHPPTVYFPLIVHEALMIEPTETESKESLDASAAVFKEIYDQALLNPEALHEAPHKTPVGRPDEVEAARNPKVRYDF